MTNETFTPPTTLRLGYALPVLAVLALGLALLVGNEACSAEAGCVEGAKEIWRGYFPDWVRRALRGLVQFVLSPWLWILMIGVGITERFRPARGSQKTLSTGAAHDIVAWLLIDKLGFGLLVASIFSYSAAVALYNDHFAFLKVPGVDQLPQTVRFVLAFVLADFLNWLHHLVRHKVRAFWVFHAVHHSQREMNIFTDDRVHPFDKLIAMPIILYPTMILQLDIPLVPWLIVGQMLYTHTYNGNLRTDYGPLRYLFVTPQSHRVHHSTAHEHADKNFGVIFCIWDRLFGTHMDAVGEYPQTGVDDPMFPMETDGTFLGILKTYALQFVYPFQQIWRRIATGQWELPAG